MGGGGGSAVRGEERRDSARGKQQIWNDNPSGLNNKVHCSGRWWKRLLVRQAAKPDSIWIATFE